MFARESPALFAKIFAPPKGVGVSISWHILSISERIFTQNGLAFPGRLLDGVFFVFLSTFVKKRPPKGSPKWLLLFKGPHKTRLRGAKRAQGRLPGTILDGFGVDLGLWKASRDDFGWIWGRFGVDFGSYLGRFL